MKISRRAFVKLGGATLITYSAIGCASSDAETVSGFGGYYTMPDEGEPHSATWMAYGATADAWGTTGNYGVSRAVARKDLLRIAAHLSRFEPVKMLVSNSADKAEAEAYFNTVKSETVNSSSTFVAGQTYTGGKSLPAIEAGGAVEFLIQPVDDLWMRDTGPVFVWGKGDTLAGVNFNFNGWGQEDTGEKGWSKDYEKEENGIEEQPVFNDQEVAGYILGQAGAEAVPTWLVMEGGGIEVNGHGTAICTESCILNNNRNPGASKGGVERELERLLGVTKVIWLPGIKAQEITDGHIDFYARFVGRSTVVYALDGDPESSDYEVTLENQEILKSATDTDGNAITAIALNAPDFDTVKTVVNRRNWSGADYFNEDSFAAGYVGFYVANDCVLMSQFGDDTADKTAFAEVQALFPDRTVIQIRTDGIANGGGSIHCATQQQIA